MPARNGNIVGDNGNNRALDLFNNAYQCGHGTSCPYGAHIVNMYKAGASPRPTLENHIYLVHVGAGLRARPLSTAHKGIVEQGDFY